MPLTCDQDQVRQHQQLRRDNVLRMCRRHGTYLGYFVESQTDAWICDGQVWRIGSDWARQQGPWLPFAE